MSWDDEERRLAIACLRYAVISDAVEADVDITDVIKETAAQEHLRVDGGKHKYSERQLWRYLRDYRGAGLDGLKPKLRRDSGTAVVLTPDLMHRISKLRRERLKDEDGKLKLRSTASIIDILVRQGVIARDTFHRSTVDRHMARAGLARSQLRATGKKVFRQVETHAPFELVIADFHHGPYVRPAPGEDVRRALLLVFIDHFSRDILEGRYYLHEDFEALRFGFKRALVLHGCFEKLYVDNGPSFQARRFHAACTNKAIDIRLVHSKRYTSEGRGACERFNRTVADQFEAEVNPRPEPLTLSELNAFFEAWLEERYRRDKHSETGEPPRERFERTRPVLRPAPEPMLLNELLRIREKRSVHKKWSTVQVGFVRYLVDPSLRNRRRKVQVLHDPFDRSYVLIEVDGQIVQRAFPQKPGAVPPEPEPQNLLPAETDYLALLRADFERRQQAELSSLRLKPRTGPPELPLPELISLLEACRGRLLSPDERTEASATFRKFRPIEPKTARAALDSAVRRKGAALHIRVYLDALSDELVRSRSARRGTES